MSGDLIRLEQVKVGSLEYEELLELRFLELRVPLGLEWTEEDLKWEKMNRHFGLYLGDEAIGVMAVQGESDQVTKLRQIATARDFQGRGYGRRLMELVEKQLAEEGVGEFELNARMSVVGFYEKLGYEREGEVFEEIGIPHVRMRKGISQRG